MRIRIYIIILFITGICIGISSADPISLSDAIDMAFKKNLNHKYRKIDYKISKIEEKEARARLYPKITLDSSYKNDEDYSKNLLDYSVGLEQPVYWGGKLRNDLRMNRAEKESQFFRLRESENDLEKQVIQAYMRITRSERILNIRLESIKQAKSQLEFVEKEFKAGRRGNEAVLRWQVLVSNYKEDAINLNVDLEINMVDLNRLLERDLSSKVSLVYYGSESFDIDYKIYRNNRKRYSLDKAADAIFQFTLQYSPAIRRRDMDIKVSEYKLKSTSSSDFPRFDLFYDYCWSSGNTVDSKNNHSVGMRLKYYIYNRPDKEAIRIQKEKLKQVRILKFILIRDVQSEIRRLYSRQISSMAQVHLKRKQALKAKDYLDEIIEKYRKGKATDVGLIDAYNSYYNNQFSEVRALYSYYIERQNLRSLMGYSNYQQTPSLTQFIIRQKGGDDIPDTFRPISKINRAIDRGDSRVVMELLANNPEIARKKAKGGWTPLHCAAFRGRTKLVKLLLSKGVNINARVDMGMTPLYLAINNGQTDVVKFLLSKGADLNIPGGRSERTPLQRAAGKGRKEIVLILLKHGADVNSRSKIGWTPLHSASEAGNKDVIEILLKHGADVNIKTQSGNTAIQLAETAGRKEIVELLRKYGAKEK